VPPTAVTREPTGPAARPVSAGAVVVRADLAGPVSPPVGWVVFALPADGAPHLQPGDRVAVFGGGQLLGTGISAGLSPAAPGGTVEVAVDPVWAAAVAQQLAAHTIAIAREVPAGT